MTVAIPLKHQLDHTELKYCLRSIDKFLPGISVIVITTHLPHWINNVIQISVKDIEGRKQLTIKKKIFSALEYDPEILCIHDDIFLLRPFEKKYYCWGDITLNSESGARMLIPQLQELNKPISHYDVHSPIVYEADKFKALESFTSDTVVKSAYGNFWHIDASVMPDIKINTKTDPRTVKQIIKNRPYFSSGPQGIKYCLPVLDELFPGPCRFEI
jgi:hypothetical protein